LNSTGFKNNFSGKQGGTEKKSIEPGGDQGPKKLLEEKGAQYPKRRKMGKGRGS